MIAAQAPPGSTIGLGQIGTVNLSKTLDKTSARLMQLAVTGSSAPTGEIRFLRTSPETSGSHIAYLVYKLDRCFVKSWSTSSNEVGIPSEDLSLYFNKIAFRYYHSDDFVVYADGGTFGWDLVQAQTWTPAFTAKPPEGDE